MSIKMKLTRKLLVARKEIIEKRKNKLQPTSIYDILDVNNIARDTLQALKTIAAKELIVTTETIANVPCTRFQPNWDLKYFSNTPKHPEILMIYIHGGGFVGGFIEQGTYFIKAIERRIGCNTIAINYSLSPEVVFPYAINQIVNVYSEIIKNHKPNKIIVAGESAGGNLCLSLLLKIKELGLPMPKMGIVASGYLDLTNQTESFVANEKTDVSLSGNQLTLMAKAYINGEDHKSPNTTEAFKNPLVSPVYGDYSGLPPIFFSVCRDELLYSDTVKAVEICKQCKVKHKLYTAEKCFHAHLIMGDFFAESKIATNELAEYIQNIFKLKEIYLHINKGSIKK